MGYPLMTLCYIRPPRVPLENVGTQDIEHEIFFSKFFIAFSLLNRPLRTKNYMDTKIEIQTEEQRLRPKNSEVERLFADNTKAGKLLGWQPNFEGMDGFRKGIADTVDWFLNPENLKAYKADIYNI